MKGVVIGAVNSDSGKTLLTMGLTWVMKKAGFSVQVIKSGPDFIDPQFHALNTAKPCYNIDIWAMREEMRNLIYKRLKADFLIVEGAMGLFDGALDGSGSTADLAQELGLPVLLVVNAAKIGQSVAAIVEGFMRHRKDVKIIGVVFNQVNSAKHREIIKNAIKELNLNLIVYLPTRDELKLEQRYLGLRQACELNQLGDIVKAVGGILQEGIDIEKFVNCLPDCGKISGLKGMLQPEGVRQNVGADIFGKACKNKKVTIVKDIAFSFCYQHLIDEITVNAREVRYVSALNDERIDQDSGFIYLPGGYPEIYAQTLADSKNFLNSLVFCANHKIAIYAECGGYMVLGEGIVDKNGNRYEMSGLLAFETSFVKPKMQLGYRVARLFDRHFENSPEISPLSKVHEGKVGEFRGGEFRGHEFHYSTIEYKKVYPAFGAFFDIGEVLQKDGGISSGNLFGSYFHLIDRA